MSKKDADEYFKKGVEALENDRIYLARECFERANEFYRCPSNCSFLAICLAKARGQFKQAIELALEAIGHEPDNTLHYLHLGKIHLLAGDREKAIEIFREGLRRGNDADIVAALDELGTRKPPVFARLHRDHPLNKYMGKLLRKMGLR